MQTPILMSWSGGKDCFMALDYLQREGAYRICALVTSVSRAEGETEVRVPIHELHQKLLASQAASLDLPLCTIEIPSKATNTDYEGAWLAALDELRVTFNFDQHISPQIAFGDLFLEDVRLYREDLLLRGGWRGLFPLWKRDTKSLVSEFIERGSKAIVTSVDRTRLDASFAGEVLTNEFISRLPAGIDPCGENGEFHTFVFDGPLFGEPVGFVKAHVRSTATQHICDLVPF